MREGTEGPYVGNGGSIRVGTPHEIANEVSVNTAYGVERVVRYAFELAEKRRKKLTLVHKTNVLTHAGGALGAARARPRRPIIRTWPGTTSTSTPRPSSS